MSHKQILPQIKTKEFIDEHDEDIIFNDLIPNLVTCYVEDKGSTMQYISVERLKELGITHDKLHGIALENLSELDNTKKGIKILDHDDGTKALTYETFDSYDATRILLLFSTEKLEYFIEILGDPFYVAIPCRDFLIATPKHFEGKLGSYAKQLYSEKEYPLTPTIMIFSKESRTFQ